MGVVGSVVVGGGGGGWGEERLAHFISLFGLVGKQGFSSLRLLKKVVSCGFVLHN